MSQEARCNEVDGAVTTNKNYCNRILLDSRQLRSNALECTGNTLQVASWSFALSEFDLLNAPKTLEPLLQRRSAPPHSPMNIICCFAFRKLEYDWLVSTTYTCDMRWSLSYGDCLGSIGRLACRFYTLLNCADQPPNL
jgi:hypothetical protein